MEIGKDWIAFDRSSHHTQNGPGAPAESLILRTSCKALLPCYFLGRLSECLVKSAKVGLKDKRDWSTYSRGHMLQAYALTVCYAQGGTLQKVIIDKSGTCAVNRPLLSVQPVAVA
ncbi:hypothetical protein WJX77_001410 [Trebouxia sp. C0004]